jgi:hypothetical protein
MAIEVYFISIWYILWPFGNLEYFSHFGILHQVRSGNRGMDAENFYSATFLKG